MAATVTVNADDTRYEFPGSLRKVVHATIVVAGADGAANGDIPATQFGLNKIEEVSPLVKSDDSLIVVAAPSYDKSSLLGKAAATAAAADIPAGTYKAVLKGS